MNENLEYLFSRLIRRVVVIAKDIESTIRISVMRALFLDQLPPENYLIKATQEQRAIDTAGVALCEVCRKLQLDAEESRAFSLFIRYTESTIARREDFLQLEQYVKNGASRIKRLMNCFCTTKTLTTQSSMAFWVCVVKNLHVG